VANMMDRDVNHAEDSEEEAENSTRDANPYQPESESEHEIADIVPAAVSFNRASVRGLQQVLAQGWLIQRARDMCSFTHDKYRQAVTHMATQLPDIMIMQMCLRVCLSYLYRYRLTLRW